jgi:hypothetical protein
MEMDAGVISGILPVLMDAIVGNSEPLILTPFVSNS